MHLHSSIFAEFWGFTSQKRVRDPRAGYIQSLDVLKAAKDVGVYTKSSLMLGLGETDEEIIDAMLDLKHAGVALLITHGISACWSLLFQRKDLLFYSSSCTPFLDSRLQPTTTCETLSQCRC